MFLLELAIGTMLRVPESWTCFQHQGRVYRSTSPLKGRKGWYFVTMVKDAA